jgi:hypothetical protein
MGCDPVTGDAVVQRMSEASSVQQNVAETIHVFYVARLQRAFSLLTRFDEGVGIEAVVFPWGNFALPLYRNRP